MFECNQVKLEIAPIGWTNDDMPELGGDRKRTVYRGEGR